MHPSSCCCRCRLLIAHTCTPRWKTLLTLWELPFLERFLPPPPRDTCDQQMQGNKSWTPCLKAVNLWYDPHSRVPHGVRVSSSVWATLTRCHRQESLSTTEIYFSQFLKSEIRVPAWSFLMRALFQVADYCLAISSHGRKRARELSGVSFIGASHS